MSLFKNWPLYKDVYEARILNFDTLNCRIFYFDYGPICTNKPPAVKGENVKNGTLKYSSSEMLTFVFTAGAIFGDLIPENDSMWDLYVILREILVILMSPHLLINDVKRLEVLIAEHHELYMHLFKTHLKPKHHHMIHYPGIIKKFGPLVYLWSMRYESKHRASKAYANSNCCKKNLTKTLAIKHQLQMCERLFSGRSFDERLFIGNRKNLKISTLLIIQFFMFI